jgi:hypothetical protein
LGAAQRDGIGAARNERHGQQGCGLNLAGGEEGILFARVR